MSTSPQTAFGGTALNQFSFKLRGEKWNETDWKTPELGLDVVNNNPRIGVWPNNPSEADKTVTVNGRERKLSTLPITCRMKWSDLFKFLYLMDTVIESKEPVEYTMSFKGQKYENGEKVPGKQVIQSRMNFGLDAEGRVYMKVYEKDRDKTLFIFKDEFWVPIQRNGEDMTKSEDSKLAARGWFNAIKEVLGPVAVNYYIPQAAREDKPAGNKYTTPNGNPVTTPDSPATKDIDVTVDGDGDEGW